MSEIKAGDTVRLKTGGPEMTVQRVRPIRGAECKWFVGDTLHEGVFAVKSLVLIAKSEDESEPRAK